MSATSGHNLATAGSHTAARQRRLRRTLLAYGVLRRDDLYELADAEHWTVPFHLALERGVRSGRLRRLGGDLYEAGPRSD